MAKDKTMFVCSHCGYESAKWLGKCPSCGQWSTFKEIKVAADYGTAAAKQAALSVRQGKAGGVSDPRRNHPVKLHDISHEAEPRIDTHDEELNRVLGGGIVPGSIILLGGVPVILIGHINKEGTLAGPKILEHIVDTVIQFEGDQHYMYRILRSIKNRFGSTSELGIYEMGQEGLRQVSNPSELLLTEDHEGLSGIAISSAIEGVRPFLVETQALVSTAAYGTPQRSATGFDQRRLNMLLAVLEKRVGFKLIQKDVFLNIAGGLRVTDMAMDLSVIAAVLSSNVDTPIEAGWCMAGEVGLSGEVRPISRVEQRISEAEKLGFTHMIIPAYNLKSIDKKKHKIQLHPVRKVEEALRFLFG